ncbi:hypothetical protein XIS1_490016 [Xenorhabdus innexi]|uniref:Uncharacterized protein n=1 Tax=Xenorhabdus innexi TaxID=290109 RepID=A0A1N6MZ45_9GAMM|nr:hypothetical protein XIS1_490016 [Xenorhabdus innexi]
MFFAHRHLSFNRLFHQLQQQSQDLRLTRQQNRLSELHQKLIDGLLRRLKQNSVACEKLNQRLLQHNPEQEIRHYSQNIQEIDFYLKQTIEGSYHAIKKNLLFPVHAWRPSAH